MQTFKTVKVKIFLMTFNVWWLFDVEREMKQRRSYSAVTFKIAVWKRTHSTAYTTIPTLLASSLVAGSYTSTIKQLNERALQRSKDPLSPKDKRIPSDASQIFFKIIDFVTCLRACLCFLVSSCYGLNKKYTKASPTFYPTIFASFYKTHIVAKWRPHRAREVNSLQAMQWGRAFRHMDHIMHGVLF